MDYDELVKLVKRLRRGYGSSAGRAGQVAAYQVICDEAAVAIIELQARVAELEQAQIYWVESATKEEQRCERAEADLAAARALLRDMKPHWDAFTDKRICIGGLAGKIASLHVRLAATLAAAPGEKT